MNIKLLLTLFPFVPLLVYSSINSGGGESMVGQSVNQSSIGSYIGSSSSSIGDLAHNTGLLNIIFIPYLTSNEVDSDGDGIPDNWELANGLSDSEDNRNMDSDGDGILDISEFISGTNPNDPSSFLNVQISVENGQFKLSFDSIEGRSYALEVSQDLNSFYSYYQINGNGSSVDIFFNPLDEANFSIFGNNNSENIFFRLIVENN